MTIFLSILGVVFYVASVYGAYITGQAKAYEETSEIMNEVSELLSRLSGWDSE